MARNPALAPTVTRLMEILSPVPNPEAAEILGKISAKLLAGETMIEGYPAAGVAGMVTCRLGGATPDQCFAYLQEVAESGPVN